MQEIYVNFAQKMDEYIAAYNCKRFVIALSGGSDSLALLFLMQRYAQEKNRYLISADLQIAAVTVDHKLRTESCDEALQMSTLCESIDVPHQTLIWEQGQKIAQSSESGIQDKARNARYDLICTYCKENNIDAILIGHQFNDQLEQILMRLSMGAGIYGLTIPEIAYINNVMILRPLLWMPKSKCEEYLVHLGANWITDASNYKDCYLRNIVRPIANNYLQISNEHRLKIGVESIIRASNALSNIADDFINQKVVINDVGYITFNKTVFITNELEVAFLILKKLLMMVAGNDVHPRISSLKILYNFIKNTHNTKKQLTLSGNIIYVLDERILIYKEIGKKLYETLVLSSNNTYIWDRRYEVTCNYVGYDYLVVACMNNNDYLLLSKEIKNELRSLFRSVSKDIIVSSKQMLSIIFTLPCIKYEKEIVAIPNLGYYSEKSLIKNVKSKFITKIVVS